MQTANEKLNSVISKAKGVVKSTQEATEAVKSNRGEYVNLKKVGKGFSKYEANKSGTVRRVDNGAIQMIPTGKKKYLLFNDQGGRSPLDPAEIKALFPKAAKAQKAPRTKEAVDVKPLLDRKDVKAIVDLEKKKHVKIFLLNKKGLSNKEVAAVLGTNTGHVYNELKRYAENPDRINA